MTLLQAAKHRLDQMCPWCLDDLRIVGCRHCGKGTSNTFQLYSCGHEGCGLVLIRAAKPYERTPYCPHKHETESEAAHVMIHRGSGDLEGLVEDFGLDELCYVRYTHYDYKGDLCCEFVCLGSDEIRCPNCGDVLEDAYRQQADKSRWVERSAA